MHFPKRPKWLLPLRRVIFKIQTVHFSLFGPRRGAVREGRTQAGCEEGRVEGAGEQDMFVPIWSLCCYTTFMDSMYSELMTQYRAPRHPTLCQPLSSGCMLRSYKYQEIRIIFFLTMLTKVIFILCQVNATCASHWPAIGGEIMDSGCPPLCFCNAWFATIN